MRRVKTVSIAAEGRDKGKTFVITEMPSDQGERWAIQALMALANAGVELPDGAAEAGMAGFAAAGLKALGRLPFAALDPLLQDMWGCVQYQHGPGLPLQSIMAGPNCQIAEIATRITLRIEVLELHTGFSLAGVKSTTE